MTITRRRERRGTAAAWTAADEVLDAGEIGYETDTGKFKIGDGMTAWTALPYAAALPSHDHDGTYPTVLARDESTVTITGTDEATAFTFTIPGGTLAIGDRLRVVASFDMLNNAGGGNVIWRRRIKLGATSIADDGGAFGFGSAAQRRKAYCTFDIAVESLSAQRLIGDWQQTGAATSSWASVGSPQVMQGTAAEDLSGDQALAFTVLPDTAGANIDFRLLSYIIQRIPA